ncbi:hypothetical protein SANT12839_085680 [Streptomyces antimycoticus]|uniref:Uncharacterized protein n=1 Tax=Streptomyces antimycoticus TaxID=68175 RepID=A0A4D4KLF3_9ACTN|nr:hypothetical protein SANT12839_085680 [Streptomyces antimycoticus]
MWEPAWGVRPEAWYAGAGTAAEARARVWAPAWEAVERAWGRGPAASGWAWEWDSGSAWAWA